MTTTQRIERIYTIPLRNEWRKVPSYKRARKGVVALKEFIAHHMKVPERNVKNVKLDTYLNNDMWSRGSSNAPNKVKVKAVKEGDIVTVTFADTPKHILRSQDIHGRKHKKPDTKAASAPAAETKTQTEEEKKAEKEKETSTAIAREEAAEQDKKAQKHTSKVDAPKVNRMALKK